MNSKIKAGDFFCFLEMMNNHDVELRMNELTYKKIIGSVFGITNYATITNIIPIINGININFDSTMTNDIVEINATYTPHTKQSFEIEIL